MGEAETLDTLAEYLTSSPLLPYIGMVEVMAGSDTRSTGPIVGDVFGL